MRKPKQKDLSLDEIIRQFIRCADRIEKQSGGYLHVQIQFGPKPKRAEGKDATPK